MVTLVCHGAYKGKTFTYRRRWKFVNGVLNLPGDMEQQAGVVKYLSKCIQAYPQGLTAEEGRKYGASLIPPGTVDDKQPKVPRKVQPSGEGSTETTTDDGSGSTGDEGRGGGSDPDGSGQEDSGVLPGDPGIHPRLKDTLLNLDPENDDHWTEGGKPAVAAVEALLGSGNVTRKDITAVAPNLTRDSAREAQTVDEEEQQ